ncbi:MAG: ATP-binding protein, partial [Thermoanaerobaculia bacterium]
LLLAVFVVVLLTWRSRVVHDLETSALAVTRAFSVSALETLLDAESGAVRAPERLDDYIEHLMRDEPRVRSVRVYDAAGNIVSASSPPDRAAASPAAPFAGRKLTVVYRSPHWGWVVETNLPLRTAGRNWGLLEILSDAGETRRELTSLYAMLGAGTLGVVAALLLVLHMLVVRETRPLTTLASVMNRFDFDSGSGTDLPESDDEIGTVVRQFNRMRARLAQSKEELLSAQRQIFHAERLAAIGRLASGVAHEVNNPLNGIRSCLYAIRQEPENGAQTTEYLGLIEEGIGTIEGIVQKLLGFARTSRGNAPVALNDEIAAVLALLAYRLEEKDVDVTAALAPDLPPVRGEASLVQEVLMNLVLNAFDAVASGGHVTVRTAREGDFVNVDVEDDGCGIAEEDLPKVFEPFFTTKEPGRGTGLGLSVVQRIVEAHGGTIAVRSRKGEGSCFTVHLPAGGTK